MKHLRKSSIAVLTVGFLAIAVVAYAAAFTKVKTGVYDPVFTHLAASTWVGGIGCPDGANLSTDGSTVTGTVSEPACGQSTVVAGDPNVQGLLVAKTGPTGNYAAGVATLSKVKNTNISELGYDIRKPNSTVDPSGSACGAGAPRFNVTTLNNLTYFVGCNSPSADIVTVGSGWLRLHWGTPGVLMAYPAAGGGPVNIFGFGIQSVSIVFDEGQDTVPNFAMSVLDNIDYNGVMVGHG
jgi:hypothetical protein